MLSPDPDVRAQGIAVKGVRTGVQSLLPAILFLTAIGKLADWDHWRSSVDGFVLLPSWCMDLLSVVLPAVEAAPFVVFVSGRRLQAVVCSLGLVSLFTGVLLWHWANNVKPTCACLGLWARYLDVEGSIRAGLVRNGVLWSAGFAGLLASIRSWRRARPSAVGR